MSSHHLRKSVVWTGETCDGYVVSFHWDGHKSVEVFIHFHSNKPSPFMEFTVKPTEEDVIASILNWLDEDKKKWNAEWEMKPLDSII